MASHTTSTGQMRLYDRQARRLYINADERARFLAVCQRAHPDRRAFGLTLLYTGCRISEALALTPQSLQLSEQVITFRTLKRRSENYFREVPIPTELADVLRRQMKHRAAKLPVWQHRQRPLNRSTAYRWIKALMADASIAGVQACPKGLRHGFAIRALSCSMPLNLVQKWMDTPILTRPPSTPMPVGLRNG